MAAGQPKKRLTNSNFHDQYRGKKKKKVESSEYILNLTSHIDLEWNDNQKRAVAKQEQIGISWMDMAPFIDSVSQSYFGVADVISVPPEIFSLENVNEVLSYEVWATCLAESDRRLLAQFLPIGTSAEQVVHSLLEGDNHHFGNPFMKWFTSLQAGNLHPDVVLCKEKQFRASKRAYYYELKQYHISLLGILMKWKEKWLGVQDPVKLLSDVYATSKQGPIEAPSERAKDPNMLKIETLDRTNLHNGATDKYLSYIKISRAQHNLLKKMTQSGGGIQSKSLTHVLGDIKCFPLQHYENFEEEDTQQMHEHWLHLVNKDLPKAFELLRDRKLQREEWKKSLEWELAEKKISLVEEDVNIQNIGNSPQGEAADNADEMQQSASSIHDECDNDSVHNSEDDQMLEDTSFNSNQEPGPLTNQGGSPNKTFQAESGKATVKPEDEISPVSESLSESPDDNIMEPQGSMSSTKDMWEAATLRDPNYHGSPNNHGYESAGELSLSQPQYNLEYSTQVIDLERDIMKPEAQSSVYVGSEASLFCSYPKQVQNEMLPAFPKGPGMLTYPHESMNGIGQPGPFFMTDDGLAEPIKFPIQCQQQRLLEQREAMTGKDLYVTQMHKKLFSPDRYQSQGQIPSIDQQSFVALQPSMTSSVGYNWVPGENQAYNSWSGVDSSSTDCLGDVGNSDGSLYSLLNNKLPPYSTSAEQYAQVRNFVGGIPNASNIYTYAPPQLNNLSPHDSAGAPSSNGGSWINAPQNHSLHDSMGRPFLRPWDQ